MVAIVFNVGKIVIFAIVFSVLLGYAVRLKHKRHIEILSSLVAASKKKKEKILFIIPWLQL